MIPYTKHVPTWMQQVTTFPDAMTGARSSGFCDGPALATAVYGDLLDPNSGLAAFAYLWRRFGPPWYGCDDHKEFVSYILGTSHPEVCLLLGLSGSALPLAVGYFITQTLQHAWCEPDSVWERQFAAWWVEHHCPEPYKSLLDDRTATAAHRAARTAYWEDRNTPEMRQAAEAALGPHPHRLHTECPTMTQALTDALAELLRPVCIRDVPITILGRLDEAQDWPEDYEEAPVSPYAGLGVPQEAMAALLKGEAAP